ncbi:hypothetical protein MXB_4417 [Myxobolus squamalis]|nr:hypothetical protein MXB_4417 [Myxobolus squamalis]
MNANSFLSPRDSGWAVDVLCQLGFCFCDPDDINSLCANPQNLDRIGNKEKCLAPNHQFKKSKIRRCRVFYIKLNY